jgi:phage baseplate assembly protein W
MAGFLPSPAGLQGQDVGAGNVALQWTYSLDITAQNIVFDVFAGSDPLNSFRSRVAADVASLSVTVGGFVAGGDCYFTVVAKRDPLLSLPSTVIDVPVQAVAAPTQLSPPTTASSAVSGLGFPFKIDALGAVFADGGDSLLHGKILQLLLTSPGERVNNPEFGTRLRDLVFDPNSDVLAATTEFMIRRALQNFMADEVHVEQVSITNDDDQLTVNLIYLRKADLRVERVSVGIPLPT